MVLENLVIFMSEFLCKKHLYIAEDIIVGFFLIFSVTAVIQPKKYVAKYLCHISFIFYFL